MNAKRLPVVLRNRNFLLMWLGQMLGQAGLRMFQIAVLWWLVSSLGEGSGKAVGIFMVAAAVPSIAFVRAIGRTIDRTGSRRILLAADAAAAAALALAAFLMRGGQLSVPAAVFLGFLAAAAEAFLDPTFNKAVKETVPDSDLENAVSFQASTQSIANFGGAVLGAALMDSLGPANILFLCALSYLAAGGFNYFIGFRPARTEEGPEAGLSGLAILKGLPALKKVLIGFGLVNFFVTPTLVIIPLYTSRTLQATASVLGQLEASLWIGLISGTFLSKRLRFAGNAVRLGAWCILATGIALIVPGLLPERSVYMAALFITGFAIGVNNVKFITLFQETVDSSVKGRFFALMQAMIGFTFPVAYFLFGLMADYFRPQHMCLLQGLGLVPLAVFFMKLSEQPLGVVKE